MSYSAHQMGGNRIEMKKRYIDGGRLVLISPRMVLYEKELNTMMNSLAIRTWLT